MQRNCMGVPGLHVDGECRPEDSRVTDSRLLCAVYTSTVKRKMDKWWILKFTDEGGVWASDTSPSGASLSNATRSGGSTTPAAPLQVGDFVLGAERKRAQIKNIFLSSHYGSLAQLFYIDTAEEDTQPLHRLSLIPEDMLYPPLAQHFSLEGISPQLNTGCHDAGSDQVTSCVGRSDVLCKKWGLVAMETLRNVLGQSAMTEVVVNGDVKPGDQLVVYCNTDGGQVNFNQFLLEAGLAVLSPRTKPHPSLPSTNELLSALESLEDFQTDMRAVSKAVKPVEPVKKTSFKPAAEQPTPYQYYTVYVDSPITTRPHCSLEEAGFPSSICKLLTLRGFKTPSLVQACGWPIVAQGNFTTLISPPLSGKTLAYLLPLVTKREVARQLDGLDGVPQPRLIVLVASSWDARAVFTRAQELISALSASRRFRCCFSYKAVEGEVTVQLLNGVEILVCTPTSLIRLVERTVASLESLTHLVLDGVEQLLKNFSHELPRILALCSNSGPIKVVVTSSKWCSAVQTVSALISSHTHLPSDPTHLVIACPIEATIRARVKMDVIPCLEHSPDSILQQLLNQRGCGHSIICVSTMETANRVSQFLKTLCWPVKVAKSEEEGRGFEQLLQKETVIILPDTVIPSLLPGQPCVSHLLHYELPGKKADFTNRLALLFPAMHRKLPCSHTVLLTNGWTHRADLLLTVMERSNQSPPQPLVDMVSKAQQAKEEQRKNYDLCYKLKAWGVCSNPLCPSRHAHITSSTFLSPRPLQLPLNGSVKLKVSHVSTATRWWVSLQGHAPLYRGAEPVKSHDPDGLMKMTSELAHYFTPEKQRELLHSVPAEGNYCALRDRDGCFYRVRILQFSRPLEFMFHHREKAKVRLIDIGEARIVDVSQLLPLPTHLLTQPALVFEIYVCGVRPTDFDPDWPPQAAQAMREVYQDHSIHGRVVLVSGETLWLDPVERRYSLEGLNISTALTSPQQQLVKAGMAEPNPDHLVKLSNHLGLPLVSVHPIAIDSAGLSFASLPDGDGCEVCVSAVESPNVFYLQLMATEDKVIKLEDTLNRDNEVGTMTGCRGVTMATGTVCAAQFSYNGSWYRGRVLEVKGEESQIQFLDYGNVEWVPNHLVQPIDPTTLELPFQAIECTFGMEDTKWSVDASTLLYEWTRELILVAKVVEKAPSTRLSGAVYHTVQLYEQTGGDLTNIALRLPAERPVTAAKSITLPPQAVSSTLDCLCLSLSNEQTEEETEAVAMAIKNTVYDKPGVCVSGPVLTSVCQLLSSSIAPSVSVPLLKALCCMATFHSSVCVELSHDHCLSELLKVVENCSGEVLSRVLALILSLIQYTSRSTILYTKTTLELLLRTYRTHGNSTQQHRTGISHHMILLIGHITNTKPDLLQMAVEQGIIPLLCRWLSSDVSSSALTPPSSPHTQTSLVLCALGILGGVACLVTCQEELALELPLETLHRMILRDSTVQIVHAILRLLIPLSSIPSFASRLCSSSLFSGLHKLPMSATTRILLHQLSSLRPNDDSSCNQSHISAVSNSNEESPPPLVDSDYGNEVPLTFSSDSSTHHHVVQSLKPSHLTAVSHPTSGGVACLLSNCTSGRKALILHPHVLWSQKEEYVLLAVQLRGCEERETTVNFSPTTVSFQTKVRNQDYHFSINLYAPIHPPACSSTITGSEVLLKLVKCTPVKWPRLPHGDRKITHVGVDFDRWGDDEEGPGYDHVFSNWPTHFNPKGTTYVNPILTESDSNNSDSLSEEEGEEEGWEDTLDLGFGD